MASTVAALSNVALVGAVAKSSFQGSPLKSVSAPSSLPVRGRFVCRAEENPLKGVADGTKVNISADTVKQNMAKESEKQSVFGTKPVEQGTTIPRPEMERRPETGDRSFGSVMAFDGPGPETINGRLAMVGCLWGFISEAITGDRIVDQVNSPNSPGLFWLLATAQILIFASLVPIFNGESPDSRKNGPFTAQAERWNGRIAMIGFAGILINEAIRLKPVFPHLF